MIQAAITALQQVRNWRKMLRLSAARQYEDALAVAREAPPALQSMIDWRIFEIQQLGLLKDYSAVLEKAQPLIAALLAKHSLSADEKYFLAFAQWYGQVAFRRLHPAESVPPDLNFDLAAVPLKRVYKRWKRIFPMSIHPEWPKPRG